MFDYSNEDRADKAAEALARYAEVTRNNPNDRDWAEIVRDLLGDMMHFCAQEEIDFDSELSLATGNYLEEVEEERMQEEGT